MDTKDILTRDKIFIIVCIIVFIIFLILAASIESYSETTQNTGFYSLPVPDNADVADSGTSIRVSGYYEEYMLKIEQINGTASDLNKYLVDEYSLSYQDYNQTHYLVKGDYVLSETDEDYNYLYYAVITPKDAFDTSSMRFNDVNGTFYLIRAYDYDYMMHVLSELEIGGSNGS